MAVARRMGLVINGSFQDEEQVLDAVREFMAMQVWRVCRGWCAMVFSAAQGMDKVPTRKQLMEAGRRDLCNAVVRQVGGFRRLSRLVGNGGAPRQDGALLEACWNATASPLLTK